MYVFKSYYVMVHGAIPHLKTIFEQMGHTVFSGTKQLLPSYNFIVCADALPKTLQLAGG